MNTIDDEKHFTNATRDGGNYFFRLCATTHKDIAHVSLGYTKNPGRLTESTGWKTTGLALEVARHPIHGAIPSGVGIGIFSAKLMTSGNFQNLTQK